MDLCGKSSGFADFEDPVDRGSAVIFLTRIPDCACGMFGSWVVNENWITDLSSALVGMLLCHQACCLLYYLGENNSGIHMYQFTFQPLHFCFWMWLWFRIWTKISADRRIWRKKGTARRICIPYSLPSFRFREAQRFARYILKHQTFERPSLGNLRKGSVPSAFDDCLEKALSRALFSETQKELNLSSN